MSGVKAEYERLYKEFEAWDRQHIYCSFSTHHQCPAYPKMIALGMPVVPLIFESLQKEFNWWMIDVLHEITGANPIKEKHRGRYKEIVRDWAEWGKANGHMPAE